MLRNVVRAAAVGAIGLGTALGLVGSLATSPPAGAAGSSGSGATAGKTPAQIVSLGAATSKAAPSMVVSGYVGSGKKRVRFTLSLASGASGSGTMTANGETIHLIRIGSTLYMRASKQYWSHAANSTAARLFGGKWIQVPATNQSFVSLASFLDKSELLDVNGGPKGLVNVGTAAINGRRAVVVEKRSKAGKVQTAVAVAATGKPYLIRISDGSSGQLNLSHYGVTVHPTAPANAVPFSRLQGSGSSGSSSSSG